MRIASVCVVGESPESSAWEKLRAWAEPQGLLNDYTQHPVFGFNNPSPTPDRKEYGYEFWIRVDPDAKPAGDIKILDFPGGLYAVVTCKLLGDPLGSVPEVWQKLWQWVKSGKYQWRKTHELEKPHNPLASIEDLVLDLYLPIQE